MTEEIKPKFVAGIVDVDPNLTKEQNREVHYAFWEIDTPDETHHELVCATYKKHGIDFVSHRIGKGYHYFGDKISAATWKVWHADLVSLVGNEKFPALTLRITKKYPDEVFNIPVYHLVTSAPKVQDRFRALMHFLNKEMKGKNYGNLKYSTHDCGLEKYYKVVIYPLCPYCLKSGYANLEVHVKQIHGDKI